jgi:hypothetical protein
MEDPTMAIEARIRELGVRHRNLDHQIEDEGRSLASDDVLVKELKRQKLRIKEELDALTRRLN